MFSVPNCGGRVAYWSGDLAYSVWSVAAAGIGALGLAL